MSLIQPSSLEAFLTAIASFRAVNGSYDLQDLYDLSFKKALHDEEWQRCLAIYETYFQAEFKRNQAQKKQHNEIKQRFQKQLTELKKLIPQIPEILDVWIVNSYTLGALKPTSDIDLLVITHPEAIWLARVKLTIALEKLGLRRKPGHVEEQFCLSFFITSDHLNLAPIARENDIHFMYWAVKAEPLFPERHMPLLEQNQWLREAFPSKYASINFVSPPALPALPPLSKILNQALKLPLQLKHKLNNKHLGPESSVVINDHMLKFHNIDRRKLYKEKILAEVDLLKSLISN